MSDEKVIAFAKAFLNQDALQQDLLSMKTYNNEDVDEQLWSALKKAALDPNTNNDTNSYDALINVSVAFLRNEEPLPSWLANFLADVLEEKKKRPTKRGPDSYKNWQRDYSLSKTVEAIVTEFQMPAYTTNELSEKITAAEIVSQATSHSINTVINAYKKFHE